MAKELTKEEQAAAAVEAAKNDVANKPVETKGNAILGEDDLQKLNELTTDLRKMVDEADGEREKFGEELGETQAKLEKISDSLDKLETKMQKQFDEFEADAKRKRVHDVSDSDAAQRIKSERSELFFKYMHLAGAVVYDNSKREDLAKTANDYNALLKSDPSLDDMQVKTLQVGVDTLGGFNAPTEFVEQLVIDLQEQNPVRGLFTNRTTAMKSVQIPRQTGHLSATWVTELQSRSEPTGTTFGREEITAHEMHAQVNVSREDLEDSFFNMEQFVRANITEQFGRAEGVAFVTGNGVGKPTGFTQDGSVSGTTSSISASFEADDLIAVYYSLLDQYMANASWVMKRDTIRVVRQFKDGNGQYLWAAGIAADARPATILERPYTAADAMSAIGASNVVAVFGDFRRAYTVVDRIAMEIITDIYSSKATGAVEFSGRKRVGGQVILPQAIKTLTCGS